jgi:hypothetical protein
MNVRKQIVGVAFCLTALASTATAQIDRASLKGTLTDPSGALVPNAAVTVAFPQTGFTRTVQSSSAGEYVFTGLPLGSCNLTVAAAGFSTREVDHIGLQVGQVRTNDLQLGLAGGAEVVAVNASTATLDRDDASVGGVIAPVQVQDLPINGRNWAALELLIPGAINTGSGNQLTIRFAGRGIDDNKVTFDGVDATGILRQSQKLDLRLQFSSESIAEFRALSSVYPAQYGGTTGGQVDVVSRTGTKDFHGSIYEFFRNDILNARALFSASQLPLRLNQFGASLGGPIGHRQTFFFVNYEGLRQTVAQPLIGFVPSPAYIAATQAKSPALAPLLAYYPAGQTPSSSPSVYQVTSSGRQVQNEDFGIVRIDQTFTNRTSAYLRYNLDQARLIVPLGDANGYIGDTLSSQQDPKNGVLSLLHTFRTNIVNDLQVAVNRTPFYAQNNSLAPVQIAVSGFSTLHDTLQQVQGSTAYNLVDTVNLAFGRHTLTTGGGLRNVRLNLLSTQETQYAATSTTNFQSNVFSNATFLARTPYEDARKTEYDLFIQDQYKFSRNILLSLGLRYDALSSFNGVNGHDLPFDPFDCPGGYCPSGSTFYHPDHGDLQPRVAVTWSPAFLHEQTVIRAGYGLYSGEAQLGDLIAPLSNLGQRLSFTAAQLGTPSYPVSSTLTSTTLASNAPRGLARNHVSEQVNQYTLSVEQRFPFQILSAFTYLGSHGSHLPLHTVINTLDPITKKALLPAFGLVDYKITSSNSHFNGLVAALNRQFSSGFLFGATYIWSHSVDDGTNVGSNTGGEADFPQNVACFICERASSDLDIRSSFTANVVYQLPFGHGRAMLNHGVTGRLLGDFQFSSLAVARTGLPVNVTVARTAATLPDGNTMSPQRPDLVPGVSLIPGGGRTPQNYINKTAFALPAAGTFGNAPRNLLRAPGTWQADIALQKGLFTTDRFNVNFRADVFNLFNRAQYGAPSAVFNTASFGQITTQINPAATGTATQRVSQFSLRATF